MRYRIEFSDPEELLVKAKMLLKAQELENFAVGGFEKSPNVKALHKYLEIKEIKNGAKRTSPNSKTDSI